VEKKLANLETWHHMMQKKFAQSAAQARASEKRLERLFKAHLPDEMLKKLEANKQAVRAAKPLPYPKARAEAMKVLRAMRNDIRRDQRLKKLGHKKYIRPHIRNPKFPSMDDISTELRGRMWRRVKTNKKWSTDSHQLEKAERLVKKAFDQHADFVEGPIAAPLLKGKLYHPETEALGVPNFLHKFPWPKVPEKEVSMDERLPVKQADPLPY